MNNPFETPKRQPKAQQDKKPPAKVYNTHSTFAAKTSKLLTLEDDNISGDEDYVQEDGIDDTHHDDENLHDESFIFDGEEVNNDEEKINER